MTEIYKIHTAIVATRYATNVTLRFYNVATITTIVTTTILLFFETTLLPAERLFPTDLQDSFNTIAISG